MDTKNRLRGRFEPVLNAGNRARFEALLERVEGFEARGELWVLELSGERLVIEPASPGGGQHAQLDALRACAGGLCLGEPGSWSQVALHEGFSGTLHALGQDALPGGETYEAGLCSPIDLGLSAFVVLESGGLVLYDEGREELEETDLFGLYLRLVLEAL